MSNFLSKVQIDGVDAYIKDSSLTAALNTEITNRTNADNALQQLVNTVTTDLATEEAARAAADTSLQNAISSEAQTRAAADAELEAAIADATGSVGNIQADVNFMFRMYTNLAPQAGCYVGNNYYLLSAINTSNNEAVIYRINLATGSIETQATIAGAGHVNGMCYVPSTDTAYIAVGWLAPDSAVQKTVIGISATTLTVTGRYTYDDDVTGIGSYNGEVWTFSNYNNIARKLNSDMSVSGQSVTINQDPDLAGDNAVRQTIGVYKSYIVEVYSTPQLLVFHQMSDGEIAGYINLDHITNALYWLGELENACFDGDDFYINTSANGYTAGGEMLIFKGNVVTNGISNPFNLQTINNPTGFFRVYVDASTSAAGRPLGTQAAPFRYVQEAINAIMSQDVGSVLITLLSAGDYGSAEISGVGKYIQITGPAGAIINRLVVSDATVDIRTIRVNFTDLRRATLIVNGAAMHNMSGQNNAITATFSRIHLQSGSIQTDSTDYPLYANQGTFVTASSGFTFNGTKKVYVNNGGIYAPGNGDITGCSGSNGILFDKTAIPTT